MRRSIRGALVSASATTALVLAQVGTAAATAQEVNTPSYESCPGVITQSNQAAPPFDWSVAFDCPVTVKVKVGGKVTDAKGTVTGSYAPWNTSTSDPCPNGSSFTTTVALTYTDHHGSIRFSAPMEVTGGQSSSSSGTTTGCESQYNLSYSTAQPVTATGRYAALNEMCIFALGVRTDASGGETFFAADDQATTHACLPGG